MRTFTSLSAASLLICAALIAGGCGSAAAGTHPATSSVSATSAPTSDASTDTAASGGETTVEGISGSISTGSMQAYLQALRPVHREIAQANTAADQMVARTKAQDFAGAAGLSDRVELHVARARAIASRVAPPDVLAGAHHQLVCAFGIGAKMSHRLSADMRNLTGFTREESRGVLAMQKAANRCANRWYDGVARMASLLDVPLPRWIAQMMHWD